MCPAPACDDIVATAVVNVPRPHTIKWTLVDTSGNEVTPGIVSEDSNGAAISPNPIFSTIQRQEAVADGGGDEMLAVLRIPAKYLSTVRLNYAQSNLYEHLTLPSQIQIKAEIDDGTGVKKSGLSPVLTQADYTVLKV